MNYWNLLAGIARVEAKLAAASDMSESQRRVNFGTDGVGILLSHLDALRAHAADALVVEQRKMDDA